MPEIKLRINTTKYEKLLKKAEEAGRESARIWAGLNGKLELSVAPDGSLVRFAEDNKTLTKAQRKAVREALSDE